MGAVGKVIIIVNREELEEAFKKVKTRPPLEIEVKCFSRVE